MDEQIAVMSQEELAEYHAEYALWLDQNPEYSEHLEQVFFDC